MRFIGHDIPQSLFWRDCGVFLDFFAKKSRGIQKNFKVFLIFILDGKNRPLTTLCSVQFLPLKQSFPLLQKSTPRSISLRSVFAWKKKRGHKKMRLGVTLCTKKNGALFKMKRRFIFAQDSAQPHFFAFQKIKNAINMFPSIFSRKNQEIPRNLSKREIAECRAQ